jgi:hypothetical protein
MPKSVAKKDLGQALSKCLQKKLLKTKNVSKKTSI